MRAAVWVGTAHATAAIHTTMARDESSWQAGHVPHTTHARFSLFHFRRSGMDGRVKPALIGR